MACVAGWALEHCAAGRLVAVAGSESMRMHLTTRVCVPTVPHSREQADQVPVYQ